MSPLKIDLPSQDKESQLFSSDAFLQKILPAYLPGCRWFTSKGKRIGACHLIHHFEISPAAYIVIVSINFADGSNEVYQLPLAIIRTNKVAELYDGPKAHLVLATGTSETNPFFLVDAIPLEEFRHALFQSMRDKRSQEDGLTFEGGKTLSADQSKITSIVPAIDSSNTAIIFNDRYFFKLFRKLDPGLNPDLELTRFLSEQSDFTHSPAYCGSFSVAATEDTNFINLGLMIGKVDNQGDAWAYFQELTEAFYTRLIQQDLATTAPPRYQVTTSYDDLATAIQNVLDRETYDRARLLGKRTGEMHLALAGGPDEDQDLAPEPFSESYREEVFAAAHRLLGRQFNELSYKVSGLPAEVKATADSVLLLRGLIEERLAAIKKQSGQLTVSRIHADYHLGQVLKTEDDYCIIDFEGEPLLSIPERRRKRPPFKDVAGMVRSFHYAAMGQLLLNDKYSTEQRRQLTNWGEWWFRQVRSSFLNGYMSVVEGASFVPTTNAGREDLLDFFVLEKAIYETAYELNSRPDWLPIPLKGMLFALQDNKGK
ncbi:hypothetical protein CEQ90_18965 [Lewinellaceae bacterium SD302]|nr:hypothetical protein CEQ90_18965 [Lewinellaceae bacterium SD302]